MVNISDSAKKKLILLMKEEGLSPNNAFVRLAISNKGCSGFYYDLSFDKTQKKDDNIYDLNGIKILIKKKYESYLNNIILEYNGGLQGKGFYFKNPNAKHTCGCGKSFSI
ncbi:MAG: iron-sulfur cluster assembly accessory protein [Candidatus Bostrichicola ureolyticus]|nr:MAG: iron-sulfur cluster assembly accessory protein [Candidatus Bostrichicola ureolyticus]